MHEITLKTWLFFTPCFDEEKTGEKEKREKKMEEKRGISLVWIQGENGGERK